MKKLKHLKPKGQQKYVRINNRTLIEVSVDIPDEDAIRKFNSNVKRNIDILVNPPKQGIDFFR